MNTILNDWLIELLIQTEKQRQHSRLHFYGIYSIDAFINGLLLLRVDMGKRYDISTVQLKGILYPLIYEKMFQYNETELNKINELLDRKKYTIVKNINTNGTETLVCLFGSSSFNSSIIGSASQFISFAINPLSSINIITVRANSGLA